MVLLAFWAVMDWGGAIIGSALVGEDRAIVARARDESDSSRGINDEPLSQTEISELQTALTDAGLDPGPIDGILGELTRTAIEEAAAAMRLTEPSDREVLEQLLNRFGNQTTSSDDPS